MHHDPRPAASSIVGADVVWLTADRVFAEALLEVAGVARFEVMTAPGSTAPEILESVRARHPRAVVLDVEGGAPRAAAAELVGRLGRLGCRVLVFAPPGAAVLRAECLRAGADGIASRADELDRLLRDTARVASGEPLLAEAERAAILHAGADARREHARLVRALDSLTPREQQVLYALMGGLVAKDIARELVVSLATIRTRIRSILMKLNVRSQVEAVAVAYRAGWLDAPRDPSWATRFLSSDPRSVIS